MHPPFLFFAKKRNGPCTVQRETACAAKPSARRADFLLGYGGGWLGLPTESGSLLPCALYLLLCGSASPHLAAWELLQVVEESLFSLPRCRYPGSGEGNPKGRGCGPSRLSRFKGGRGEIAEAPPVADKARRFRGSGTIGGHEQWPGIVMPRRWARFRNPPTFLEGSGEGSLRQRPLPRESPAP